MLQVNKMATESKTKIEEVLSKADREYWKVSLQPAPDHKLAPYMDRPRVFLCDKADAVNEFKKFYGIISTIHNFVVESATDEEWEAQKETDKRYQSPVQLRGAVSR